jgi:hypothetical protein
MLRDLLVVLRIEIVRKGKTNFTLVDSPGEASDRTNRVSDALLEQAEKNREEQKGFTAI